MPSAFAPHSLTTSFIHDPSLFENREQENVPEHDPAPYFSRRSDKQVERKGVINSPVNIYGLFDVLSLAVVHDHQQVHIAVFGGFAVSTGTKRITRSGLNS